ncbi:MAG: RluA family pseudouridine synthase [Phycisphaeraceae bacterium]|nr:RluA family pseudouridine synthase [Phycisphaeraceae bacterium]
MVHATDRYAVVDKPAGLLSVPGKGEAGVDCVPVRVQGMFPAATGPLTVHRLDMDTSGLLVVGLDAGAQRELSMQFERREVQKAYVAVVDGVVACDSGTIEVPIRPDYANRPYQVVDRSHKRPAVTCYKVLGREGGCSRLELVPMTGRTHQLRIHCADPSCWGQPGESAGRVNGTGHPILGDVLYGPQPRTSLAAARLLLHACRLGFTEPGTGRRVEFESESPF